MKLGQGRLKDQGQIRMGNLVPKRGPRNGGQKQCSPGVTSVTVIQQNLPDLILPCTKMQ